MKHSKRKIVVLTSLVALLTFTSALLLALAPPPLSGQGYNNLAASDRDQFLDDVFKTAAPAKLDQWKYIYIHHSATESGDAQTLSLPGSGVCDHFVIGNGNGCPDGEIEITPRWVDQKSAAAPPGVDHIEPDCVSICVIGDFDKAMPTPLQLRRLTQLVSTLQAQLRIPAERVILMSDPGTPSSVGRYFPITAFRDQVLP